MTTLHEEQLPMTNRKHSLDFDRITDIIEEDKNYENDDEMDRKNGFNDYEMPMQVMWNTNDTFSNVNLHVSIFFFVESCIFYRQ